MHHPQTIRAAGGVLWRVRNGGVQVALVHRPRYGDWSLPKGKLDDGESELAAAVREVGEETGASVAVGRRLTRVRYDVPTADGPVPKTVAYWSMRQVGGGFRANDEVDALQWASPAVARGSVSHDDDRRVLDAFGELPVAESVVVIVRHAKAGKRSKWKGDDNLRPLDRTGRAQARRLRCFLGVFGADRVVAADPVRCVQTVEPFAESAGLTVQIDSAFGDAGFVHDPDATEATLLRLARPRRVAVVSSQGEAIPGLVGRLAPGVRDAKTRKGAAWVRSLVDGGVVAADYYPDAAR